METGKTIMFLASVCAGISAGCVAFYFLEIAATVKVRTEQEEETRQLPILLKLFIPFAPNLLPIARNSSFDMTREQLRDKIIMAGYENAIDADTFIAVRMLISSFGVIAFAALTLSGNLLPGMVLGAALHFYPQVWLKKTIDNRHRNIQRALPNVLDLLTLSVEAGKDFLTSLRDILARRKKDPLGEELERTFHEIQLGKKRTQALKDLVARVKQPDLTSVMNAIIQSDELGVSIAQLLKIQGDQLRSKRFQRAEKLANEAPVKMIFPIALFIAPAVMGIMMAPLAMKIAAVFFN